jgi:hypothetical protein
MRAWIVVAVACAILAPAARAAAFCRSTTCGAQCPVDADGCKTTGVPLAWPTQCVGISIHEDASRHIPLSQARPPIVAALAEWSKRDCDGGQASIGFVELSASVCRELGWNDEGPNSNVIVFQDDKWVHGGTDNTLGKTTVTFDVQTGEILDADMEINHALNEITVSDTDIVFDLQSIVTHETGHLLGFDHSTEADTVMSADYQAHSIDERSLRADDLDALCAAYAPDRPGKCDPTPHGGLRTTCEEEPSDGCSISGARPATSLATLVALLTATLALTRRLGRPSCRPPAPPGSCRRTTSSRRRSRTTACSAPFP